MVLDDKVHSSMVKTLNNLQFLDELKNYSTFHMNAKEIRLAFQNIIQEKPVTDFELTNAISYISEDISIAEFIF